MDLEADYLLIGSGAVGMAFADVLVHETECSIVLVDRHHAPGGHWNDAYPFVRLHQPSAMYGVNSCDLGGDTRDDDPLNLGMCERASSTAILAYYDELMRSFTRTGRVRYFPMCEYEGDFEGSHRINSLLDGRALHVSVNGKIVDTTYINGEVPSTRPPAYEVAAGSRCIPPNGLARIAAPPSGYVVIGAGKTGIDVCLWLLQNGVAPDGIRWIIPRDPWLQNRANIQPGWEFFTASFESFAVQAEIAASAETAEELFARLEGAGQLLRLSDSVTPTMYHGATVSIAELRELRKIRNVVRLGRVRRVAPAQIALDRGSIETEPDTVFVDCSARGVPKRPPVPVFQGKRITPQMVRALQPTFSSALIAHVETMLEAEDDKNAFCRPIPMADDATDWLRVVGDNFRNQGRWRHSPDLRAWIARSRLDAFSALAASVTPEDTEKAELLHRYGAAAAAAPENLDRILAEAAHR